MKNKVKFVAFSAIIFVDVMNLALPPLVADPTSPTGAVKRLPKS